MLSLFHYATKIFLMKFHQKYIWKPRWSFFKYSSSFIALKLWRRFNTKVCTIFHFLIEKIRLFWEHPTDLSMLVWMFIKNHSRQITKLKKKIIFEEKNLTKAGRIRLAGETFIRWLMLFQWWRSLLYFHMYMFTNFIGIVHYF